MKYYIMWEYGLLYETQMLEFEEFDTLEEAQDRFTELAQLYGRRSLTARLILIHGELLKEV